MGSQSSGRCMPRRLTTQAEFDDFEQELVDQWSLALAGAGATDSHVSGERTTIVEFLRFVGRPLWTVQPADADRWLRSLRVTRGQAPSTVRDKAGAVARFYSFLLVRYQGDIHALTGAVISQPIDEFNRPAKLTTVPDGATGRRGDRHPSRHGGSPCRRRKYLLLRDYLAASLWRRGVANQRDPMLDIRDWRPDLGPSGKLHVRFGKGSAGRGLKTRLVPGINAVDELITWWLTDVRHQFDDEWDNPDAPCCPANAAMLIMAARSAGADALRTGLGMPSLGGCRTGTHPRGG